MPRNDMRAAAPPPAAAPPAPSADLPPFLSFAPVPVKARHDGWSPDQQLRFVVLLARGAGVEEAARRLGRSPQSAYRLRRRSGGEGFARAWDEATRFAGQARGAAFGAAALPGSAREAAVETLLVPRTYRGRLVGFTLREDLTGAMATLRRLDRLADRMEPENRTGDRAAAAGPPAGRRQRRRR